MSTVQQLRDNLRKKFNPQDAESLARLLAEDSHSRVEGRSLLHQAITEAPNQSSARLLLAKLYYLDSMNEFCIRELLELHRRTNSPAVKKLIDSFGPAVLEFGAPAGAVETKEESIVGELDIDFDDVDENL